MVSARDALERLRQGNQRFIDNVRKHNEVEYHALRSSLLEGQKPFAVILGCSDSRVPVEIVFDQSLGDLFVIRVAGNIVARSQIGSIEYAVQMFGARLVVVLGHSNCGAVTATLQQLQMPVPEQSLNLHLLAERICPALEPLLESGADREALLAASIRANVEQSTKALRHGSHIIERMVEDERLTIVGAEYCLETGRVDFFDVPSAAR